MGGHFDPSSWAMAEGHLLGRLAPPAHPTCHCGVESYFDSWRLTGNLSLCNTCPHPAVGPPFSPAGLGDGRCGVRIAIFSVAACVGPARASGLKALQRPCGTRLQKFQSLVHSPLSPNPSPPPPGGSGELNNHIRPTLCAGWRSRADANIQTRREPRKPVTPLTLPVFTLKVGRPP